MRLDLNANPVVESAKEAVKLLSACFAGHFGHSRLHRIVHEAIDELVICDPPIAIEVSVFEEFLPECSMLSYALERRVSQKRHRICID